MVKNYIATASSFKIGDGEEIKNARLRIAETNLPDADMLLGSDFFVSHHVFVSNSQHKLYLTYNGGPVFNLKKTLPAAAAQGLRRNAGTQNGGTWITMLAGEYRLVRRAVRRGIADEAALHARDGQCRD